MTRGRHHYSATIEPIEPLLFGDNRSARAGFDHLQEDQDPSPLTIHGALGKFIWDTSGNAAFPPELGEQVDDILDTGDKAVTELLGLAFRDPSGGLWFPKPLHLRARKTVRAGGCPRYWSHDLVNASNTSDDERSSCPLTRIVSAPAFGDETDDALLLSEEYLGRILCGVVRGEALDDHARSLNDVFRPDVRAGVVIQNVTGRVEEGMLFSRPYRRFGAEMGQGSWGMAAWLSTPGVLKDRAGIGFVGGDRRRARFQIAAIPSREDVLKETRDAVLGAVEASAGFLAYLLTPRIVENERSQLRIGGVSPIAAVTGRPEFASGWNVRLHQPRPMVVLEPAGSVYFFEWPEADARKKTQLVESNWLSSLGPGSAAGFGRILLGVWS